MNILVFSDTHLYLPFNQKKFNYLKRIISKSDQVIINGDFFDAYMIKFEDFIKSEWNKLFPLLKSKKTIYIYGNHDQKKFSDQNVCLFSNKQTYRLELKISDKNLIFEHGQNLRKTPDLFIDFTKPYLTWLFSSTHQLHYFLTTVFRKNFLNIRYGWTNRKSKTGIKKQYKPKKNDFYVIGHNHFGEVDEKNRFACSGINHYGFGQYLTIDSISAQIILHEEWY
jgi:predicted phosphodiesterase